jgi:hypothetical protein
LGQGQAFSRSVALVAFVAEKFVLIHFDHLAFIFVELIDDFVGLA